MKQFSLVLNVVLVVAVGILFYLHFAGAKNNVGGEAKHISDSASPASFKVVYFDIDSIENQYEYSKQVRAYVRGRQEQIANDLNQMRNHLTSKAKEYEQRGASMSQTEQTAFQQEFARMQGEFQSTNEQKNQELQGESMRRFQEVKAKIQTFLKEYSKTHGYVFVYASSDDDNLYYKDTTRNITAEMVRVLNEQFKAEKKK
ncbi:OmpH family outer membrane protein [Deminuibacter soli]|uniref:OmpH family outer membrane protein n=1 Tax=Deminuibacter soli TaxID=2291815 RepID=A0A3E1NLD7_9BACT|nr:OmpH family outer membrane protein [Deminuibacter soli]RFM28732.1 OmpH family outer membrane protein [Deminuibacter soli]